MSKFENKLIFYISNPKIAYLYIIQNRSIHLILQKMKTLIDNQGQEFQVTETCFEKVKKSFMVNLFWMLLVKDVTGNTHVVLESDNREKIFYQRNYNY